MNGLGKTLITLSALADLKETYGVLEKTLIIAPKSVAENTWPAEIDKWEHTKGLTYAKVLGAKNKRLEALEQDVDLYIINRENVPWLVELYARKWPFKIVVIDELSSFKNPSAKRFKALKKVRYKMERVIGLTGTPAPNSLIDLWPQIFLLDQGERLEKFHTRFKEKYFFPAFSNGHIVYKWSLKDGSEEIIYDQIRDIAVSMKAKDYLDLPGRTDNIVPVILPTKARKQYKDLERDLLLEMDESDVVAVNAAVLSSKLIQMANGTIYDEDKNTIEIHAAKLDELERIVDDAQGEPILIFYHYKHDLVRLKERFKKAEVLNPSDTNTVKRWNNREIPILFAHPQSAGHGLNLQHGGHIAVWYSMTWSLELYQQANARLDRQGQEQPVIIHHLVTKDTIDENAVLALQRKEAGQDSLLAALKARLKSITQGG